MKRETWITVAALGLALVVIVTVLLRDAMSGPTFRAEEHADLQACLRGIPAEWGPGSLERSGAERACQYVHRPRPAR